MQIKETDFENQDITLDFHRFSHCTFRSCRLRFHGYEAYEVISCKFLNCQWDFAGPALLAFEHLKRLYASGDAELRANVDTKLAEIRGQGAK